MKSRRHIFILFPALLLVFCDLYAATPQFAGLDFMALENGGHAYVVHVDGTGKASSAPIDFLKDELIDQWDADGLDQVAIANRLGRRSQEMFNIKYYKEKILSKNIQVSNVDIVMWLVLLPDKNLLIAYVGDGTGNGTSLVRIDLTTGVEKSAPLNQTTGIASKPIWDKASGKLIIVQTGGFELSQGPLFDSLARLDPDDLTITDIVGIGNVGIQGLLFSDVTGQHVTGYGFVGGDPPHDAGSVGGTPGFIEFDMATGKSTMVLKDTQRGDFWYLHSGIATINHRYVVMTKNPRPPIDLSGFRSFVVDLQQKNAIQLSSVPPFSYPIEIPTPVKTNPPANP